VSRHPEADVKANVLNLEKKRRIQDEITNHTGNLGNLCNPGYFSNTFGLQQLISERG
jgi:hypothetical protein